MRNRFRCRDVDSVGSALSAARPTDRWPRRSRRVRRKPNGAALPATGSDIPCDRCGPDRRSFQRLLRNRCRRARLRAASAAPPVQSRGGRRGRIGRDHRGGSSGRPRLRGRRWCSAPVPASRRVVRHMYRIGRGPRPRSPHPPVRVPRKVGAPPDARWPNRFSISRRRICMPRASTTSGCAPAAAFPVVCVPRNPCCRETCCCIGQFVGSLVGRGGGAEDRRPIRGIGRNVLPQTGAQRSARSDSSDEHRRGSSAPLAPGPSVPGGVDTAITVAAGGPVSASGPGESRESASL